MFREAVMDMPARRATGRDQQLLDFAGNQRFAITLQSLFPNRPLGSLAAPAKGR